MTLLNKALKVFGVRLVRYVSDPAKQMFEHGDEVDWIDPWNHEQKGPFEILEVDRDILAQEYIYTFTINGVAVKVPAKNWQGWQCLVGRQMELKHF